MRSIFILLFFCCSQLAPGSQLRIEAVTQPLYLHGSDSDPRISLQPVPCVTFFSDPEWRLPAISAPFIPPAVGPRPPHDINLASLYRISVSGNYEKDGKDFRVTIDASKAIQLDGYPFTIKQVIDAVVTCVKIMFPQGPEEDGVLEIAITRPGTAK